MNPSDVATANKIKAREIIAEAIKAVDAILSARDRATITAAVEHDLDAEDAALRRTNRGRLGVPGQ